MFSIAPIHLLTRILPLTIIIASAVVIVLFVVEDHVDREPISLTGIEMAELEDYRIFFLSPDDDAPIVTDEQALTTASRWDPVADVREVRLAYLVDQLNGFEGLVWVINYDPLTYPPVEGSFVLWQITVIDAETRDYVYGRGGGAQCHLGYLYPQHADLIASACGTSPTAGPPP
jgi:hypothetical protein